eukprot:761585-Hanusia_phi.AAC.1
MPDFVEPSSTPNQPYEQDNKLLEAEEHLIASPACELGGCESKLFLISIENSFATMVAECR